MGQQPGRAGYQVYVLRMWRDQDAVDALPEVWRCSLEDPSTRQRRAFESVDELIVFLGTLANEGRSLKVEEEV